MRYCQLIGMEHERQEAYQRVEKQLSGDVERLEAGAEAVEKERIDCPAERRRKSKRVPYQTESDGEAAVEHDQRHAHERQDRTGNQESGTDFLPEHKYIYQSHLQRYERANETHIRRLGVEQRCVLEHEIHRSAEQPDTGKHEFVAPTIEAEFARTQRTRERIADYEPEKHCLHRRQTAFQNAF